MTDATHSAPTTSATELTGEARVPIRLKILVGALAVILLVIAAITATMANLFHKDKTAYIHSVTALMARHAASEAGTVLRGHADDLAVFERIMLNDGLMVDQKSAMLADLFGTYSEFVAVGLVQRGAEPVLVYDESALGEAGLSPDTLGAGLGDGGFPGDLPLPDRLSVGNVTTTGDLAVLGIAYLAEDGETAVLAWVRLDALLAAARGSGAFTTTLLDGDGRLFASAENAFRPGTSREPWLPADLDLAVANQAESSREIEGSGPPLIAGFAPVGVADLFVAVRIPRSAAYLTSRELLRSLLLVALVLFAGAGLLTLIFSSRLTRPLEQLSRAVRAVGRGQFNVRLEASSSDEIGLLSNSFNQMTQELEDRDVALEQANVALIQSEKMAAFGQIGAGIAHEVKNPLAGILGYAQLGMTKLEDDHKVHRYLGIIEKETRRCTEIIGNLMKFARRESSIKKTQPVNPFVEEALAIVEHQLGLHQIVLERNLAVGLPQVMVNANQIEQVLVNFLINAQQAIGEDGGRIRVATRLAAPDRVELLVCDDGPGIDPEIVDKIFEPFFSTKPAGKGTGLGLAVTYGIVEDHGGTIGVQSQVGVGTTFIVSLPVEPSAEESEPEAAGRDEQNGE